MVFRRRWVSLAAAAAAFTLGLTSCASAEYRTGVTGSLTAIGSGSQNDAMAAWQQGWTKDFKQTSVRFSPDGDATGRDALFRGMAYFATIDSQLTLADWEKSKSVCGDDGAFAVPTSVTAIGVAYNVASLKNVKLDPNVLSAIYQGKITMWDDPKIAALNPNTPLRNLKIVPVWAKAQSGLTQAVGDYLGSSSAAGVATPNDGRWPGSTAGESVSTYPEIAKKVDDTAGAIAFMDRAAIGTRFSTATLKFGEEYANVTDDALATAVDNAQLSTAPGGGVQLSLRNGQGPGYSLGFVGYQAFCHSYKNPALARLVKSWAAYVTGEGGQANSTYFAQVGSPNAKALDLSRSVVETIKANQNDNK